MLSDIGGVKDAPQRCGDNGSGSVPVEIKQIHLSQPSSTLKKFLCGHLRLHCKLSNLLFSQVEQQLPQQKQFCHFCVSENIMLINTLTSNNTRLNVWLTRKLKDTALSQEQQRLPSHPSNLVCKQEVLPNNGTWVTLAWPITSLVLLLHWLKYI